MDWRTLAVVALLVVAGCAGSPGGASTTEAGGDSTTTTTQETTTRESTTQTTQNTSGETRVFVRDEGGDPLGNVTAEIADTPDERYTGLSEHESLGEDEGMLFVYPDQGERTYVMRSMSFPIDIVFVDADGRITEIHHATVEEDNENLTGYEGRGKWVLEVPYDWTTERGVEEGDRVVTENGE